MLSACSQKPEPILDPGNYGVKCRKIKKCVLTLILLLTYLLTRACRQCFFLNFALLCKVPLNLVKQHLTNTMMVMMMMLQLQLKVKGD